MGRWLRFCVWAAAVASIFTLATLPIGIDAQLMVALACVGSMLLLWHAPRRGIFKHVFLALGTFVVLRYVYWRTTSTLPPLSSPVDFGFGLALYLAEMYCVLVLAMSLFIIADPVERGDAPAVADDDLPTVDVFVPSYNEDAELLAGTLAAAKSMDYPPDKLTVYLLDDGGTDAKCNHKDPRISLPAQKRRATLRALAERLECRYVTRAKNDHAKAGNLNAGLAASEGQLVAVFDADHAPFRSFLRETVGYFVKDPQALPRADAALLPQSRSDREEPSHFQDACRPRTRCSTGSSSAGLDKLERLVLLRLGGALEAAGARQRRRLLRHHHHRGLRDGAGAACARAGTASMSTSR